MLPVAIRIARKNNYSPSSLLMPLSFASLLGGQLSLIGTPPNMVVSNFRNINLGSPYKMFDFTLVGSGVVIIGIIYICTIGWKLIKNRKESSEQEELFELKEGYFTELYVTEESSLIGQKIKDIKLLSDTHMTICSIEGGEYHEFHAPTYNYEIQKNDILLVQATQQDIRKLLIEGKLAPIGNRKSKAKSVRYGNIEIVEAVVSVNSPVVQRTVKDLNLRYSYGVNLIAVARQGERIKERLSSIKFKPGDILLLQGQEGVISGALQSLHCLPLADRNLSLPKKPRIFHSLLIFALAIILTSLGILQVHIAFTIAALAMILTNLLTLKQAYNSINFPILVFLGSMIQVGQALESTGGSQLIVNKMLDITGGVNPILSLAILMIFTMGLSNIINTAASAVLMAPIAFDLSMTLGVSPDTFLMAVVVSASFAFLTPIHQSNILVMGPGGYHFNDYWKMGLPLQLIGIVIAIPLLLIFLAIIR
jgi:di/tricarboxylate transporter